MLMCNPQREGGFGEEVAAAFFAFDPLKYHGGGTRKLFFGCLVGTLKRFLDFYFFLKKYLGYFMFS